MKLQYRLILCLLFVTATVYDLFSGVQTGICLATITIGGMYNTDMSIYQKIIRKIEEKLATLSWDYSKWNQFTGMIDVKKYKEAGVYAGAISLKPSGKIIDVVKDFEQLGGGKMEYPILFPATGRGLSGTATQRGHEEKRRYLTGTLNINQKRHALVRQDNKMSKQLLRRPDFQMAFINKNADQLWDWFSRWIGSQPDIAILTGYSENLTDSVYGINVSNKSHPNTYVAGDGKVTWSDTPATYETNVATALATLTDTTSDYFSAQVVKNMVFLASKHKLPKIKVNGYECYLIRIHPAQMLQLRSDPVWRDAQHLAAERGEKNQVFTGISEGYLYEGACLWVDNTIPGARVSGDSDTAVYGVAYSSTYGTVNYGLYEFMATPRDISPRKPAMVLGGQALAVGYGSELGFEQMTDDYNQFIGDEADMIVGFERPDLIDVDGFFGTKGLFYGNFGSLIYWTWSPDTVTI